MERIDDNKLEMVAGGQLKEMPTPNPVDNECLICGYKWRSPDADDTCPICKEHDIKHIYN